MATLTTEQKAEVRAETGDDNADNYIVSDVTLQALYDDADRANGDLDRLKVYVLRRMRGWAQKLVSKSNGVDNLSISANQHYDHILENLAYWESVTGMGNERLPTLAVGTMLLDLDATDDDLTEWG